MSATLATYRTVDQADVDRLAVSIPGACRALGLGRTSVYKLAKEGRLELVKFGRSSRITVRSLEALAETGTEAF